MIKKEVIAGDTFPIVYKHKENGIIANMPEGYDFMIGLRKKGSQTATIFSYRKGDIAQVGTGTYRWEISHEMSTNLEGDIMVELVVYNRDGSFVKHCIEPIMLSVLPSFMNEHLDIEE